MLAMFMWTVLALLAGLVVAAGVSLAVEWRREQGR